MDHAPGAAQPRVCDRDEQRDRRAAGHGHTPGADQEHPVAVCVPSTPTDVTLVRITYRRTVVLER